MIFNLLVSPRTMPGEQYWHFAHLLKTRTYSTALLHSTLHINLAPLLLMSYFLTLMFVLDSPRKERTANVEAERFSIHYAWDRISGGFILFLISV